MYSLASGMHPLKRGYGEGGAWPPNVVSSGLPPQGPAHNDPKILHARSRGGWEADTTVRHKYTPCCGDRIYIWLI